MKTKAILLATILIFPLLASKQISFSEKALTAEELIATIIKNTGSGPIPKTVDVIKEGEPVTPVTGIVTTMFATMDVLKKAVGLKANLIIVHEPLYYNHTDATNQFENDPVFLEKRKYIRDNKLVIWRFHDYIHRLKPDGIEAGMVNKLGWNKYLVSGSSNSFILPETNLDGILKHLKQVFPESTFNVIGKGDMKASRIKIAVGAPGSSSHIRLLRQDDTDILVAGESPQWETYEYMRDAVDQGRKKAVIFLGHIPSEEAGMDYCASWLKTFINDIPVTFVASGPSYWSY